MAHVRYNFDQKVFIYGCSVKTHKNHAEEKFAINFPKQCDHMEINFQISEDSSNPQHFNLKKAVKKKLCCN
jgi:hypothetical protein